MNATDAVRAFLEPHHLPLSDDLATFAREQIAPLEPATDDASARIQARQILDRLGEGGLCRLPLPNDDDGKPDLRGCCLAREHLAAASPLADSVFALQCLGSLPILLAGSDEQRQRHLPGVAAGQTMTAFAMTEPGAGSDVSAIQTSARRDGDDWVLNGRKHLITNAGLADLYVVFARTGAPADGVRGLSTFIVEKDRPGCVFVRPQVLSEPHPLGEIAFENCRVPATHLLGDENAGFKVGMRTLDRLRATVAAAACGMARRALDEALAHAQERRQFGQPLAEMQTVQQKLARSATELDAARLLTYRAAALADSGAERVTLESAMAKSYATEAAQRIVDDAVQIIGGRGLVDEHPVDRLYRAVRALRIYEGATEVQQTVIARQLMRR